MGIAVLINANSTGASTININGIGAVGIKKANGNDVTNLKANSIYTMRYNGTNFILQGEGGSGNATAADILAGKTASTDAGDVVGNIPTKGAQTYVPGTVDQVISKGQYIGENQIIKGDSNLKSENIVQGKTIFGVEGSAITFSAKNTRLFKPADILTDFDIYSYSVSTGGWASGLNPETSLQVANNRLVGKTTRQDRYIRLDTNAGKLGVTSIDACILNNIDMVANKSVQVSTVQDIFTRLEMELSNGKYLIYFYGNYANTPRFADAIWYTTERPTHNGQLATSKIIDSKILENTDYKNHYEKAGYIKNNEKLTLFYDDNVYTYKNSALAGVSVVSLQIWYMASFANNLSQCSIESIIIGG